MGLPNVGKSTLFNCLSSAKAQAANFPFCTIDAQMGQVSVPDERLTKLAELVHPGRIVPAVCDIVDIAGLVKGASKGEGLGNQFLGNIRECDAIIHVLRCFDNGNIVHVDGSVDPVRDKEIIDTELQLKDLETVEARLKKTEKIALVGHDKDAKVEYDLLLRYKDALLAGKSARTVELENDEEVAAAKNMFLLTTKPVLYVCNVDDQSAVNGNAYVDAVRQAINDENAELMIISAQTEADIAELESYEEKQMFMKEFERTGALKNAVVFLNLADDPAVERTLTPRLGLTTAEYMAFDLGMQVLVIMTDITNYCEALRQIGAAREEVPGRRGYPGYMYTDLAQLYERAGRIKGKKGSITQIPILSMPGGDITHPIPDLSGYITEGQIVLSMDLHRNGIYPPINVSSSLSRLMGGGTGKGKTREDHKGVSDQLYAAYAEGKDLRGLVAIVGKDSLSAKDRKLLDFADLFEDRFVRQGLEEDRSIEQTLDLGWELFTALDLDQITRIDRKYIEQYLPKKA